MMSTKYMKAAAEKIRNTLAEEGQDLKTGAREFKWPLARGY